MTMMRTYRSPLPSRATMRTALLALFLIAFATAPSALLAGAG